MRRGFALSHETWISTCHAFYPMNNIESTCQKISTCQAFCGLRGWFHSGGRIVAWSKEVGRTHKGRCQICYIITWLHCSALVVKKIQCTKVPACQKITMIHKDGEWELKVSLTPWGSEKPKIAIYSDFSVGPAPRFRYPHPSLNICTQV